MIQDEFSKSVDHFTKDSILRAELWREIDESYQNKKRRYHNLEHLDALVRELTSFKTQFNNWSNVIFAIAYHDYIYNTLKHDNEEKSAIVAKERLNSIGVPVDQVADVVRMIHATKRHENVDRETNLFTDADLSILGSDSATYQIYSKKIRKEYSWYPDLIYNPGRKKVLTHFLEMPSIFKTPEFASKYENQARANIQDELDSFL